MSTAGLETRELSTLRGPLAIVEAPAGASLREQVEIVGDDGRSRLGRVLAVAGTTATLEIFDETALSDADPKH